MEIIFGFELPVKFSTDDTFSGHRLLWYHNCDMQTYHLPIFETTFFQHPNHVDATESSEISCLRNLDADCLENTELLACSNQRAGHLGMPVNLLGLLVVMHK